MDDQTCIDCGDPLTEAEKKLELQRTDGLCEICRKQAEGDYIICDDYENDE